MVNQARIAFTLAAHRHGYGIEKWITEEELRPSPDYVCVTTAQGRRRRVAVIPDGYFVLNLGDKRARFCLEVDRATLPNKRWKQRVQAYMAYLDSGRYSERFGTRSLRVLTVTTGEKRLARLKKATEDAGGGSLFWFGTLQDAHPGKLLFAMVSWITGHGSRASLVG